MQDGFASDPTQTVNETPAVAAVTARLREPSTPKLLLGLHGKDLAWGRKAIEDVANCTGRKNWLKALSEDEVLRFSAAAFRVARIKREGMRLASLGTARDLSGWVHADPELAMATRVLSSGFLENGTFQLLGEDGT